MKYLCLVYLGETVFNAFHSQERRAMSDEAMAYCEKLQKAGQLLAASPLHPVDTATTVRVRDGKTSTIDGPFAETKEFIAGYWLWQCRSQEEAIEWVKRCPNPMPEESEIEIRQVFEANDFGAEFTPELREQEERLRAQVERKH